MTLVAINQEGSLEIRFPTTRHKVLFEAVLAGYRADSEVLGALLCGSLARGTARSDSDIDLLVVTVNEQRVETVRENHGGIIVEQTLRTATGWTKRFSPSRVGDESWGYAFLDGVPLYDPYETIAQLIAAAGSAHVTYRVPADIRAHFLWLWDHTRPKLEAVLRSNDETEIGWAAAVSTLPLTDTLWAINDRPLPSRDLGTFQRHLDELRIPPGVAILVRKMLRSPPRDALQLQLRLIDLAMPYLAQHV